MKPSIPMNPQNPARLRIHNFLLVAFVSTVLPGSLPLVQAQESTTVQITLDEQVTDKPVTGRLLVFFSKRSPQPMHGPSWFGPEPFFGLDVVKMEPGSTATIDDSADSLAEPISKIADGEYNVQAVLDHDFYYSNHASGPGNFYSEIANVVIRDGKPVESFQLTLDQVVEAPTYTDSEFVKFVEIESDLLGEFHKRPVVERAMVVLPPSYYEQPERRYPVYMVVTGFGGTLNVLQERLRDGQTEPAEGEAEFIRVYLTGQCKWGHHVYANSATNGPRGDALVKEMIPAIDNRFRTIAEQTARFVGGHSSGGWSSLWLQVTYPETFGGASWAAMQSSRFFRARTMAIC